MSSTSCSATTTCISTASPTSDASWNQSLDNNNNNNKNSAQRLVTTDSSLIRAIRQVGSDGSYYDCDSCALPLRGGWKKYWRNTSSLDNSSTSDYLGDTLVCCENCPVTLHFACVCPPWKPTDDRVWLCAVCQSQNDNCGIQQHSPATTIQTPLINLQYQISSSKWIQTTCKSALRQLFSQLVMQCSNRNTTEFTLEWIVFSAFDGIAAARLALQRLQGTFRQSSRFHVRYYASEIDVHAMQVSHTRFPDIISLGDIRQVSFRDIPEGVDLMIGGSPCQSLSRLGRQQGIFSGASRLFFEFVRLWKQWKPRYFLFENVASMNAQDKQIITNAFGGVEPILVDAAKFSAGIRYRYYWTNIPDAQERLAQVKSDDCYLQDILVDHARAQYPKAYTITTNNYAPRAFDNRFNTVWYPHDDDGGQERKRGLYIVEAERILGFPDHYTDAVECSTESQKFRTRWKLLGNSFCVFVMEAFCSLVLDSMINRMEEEEDTCVISYNKTKDKLH